MTSKQVANKGWDVFRKWVHRSAGYCKYGLYHDDALDEYSHIKEALTRLPQEIKDERNYRIIRALQLSMKKIYLPKEEWITLEEDREKGRYLQPYIKEVLREEQERKEWLKQ